MAAHKHVAYQESENGVSKKLELFIVGRSIFNIFFVDGRFVREGALDQLGILEGITDELLQRRPLPAHSKIHNSVL